MIPALLPFVPIIALMQLYSLGQQVQRKIEEDRKRKLPPRISGSWFASWHAIWNGKGWLGPLKMTAGEASDWHIAQLEAMSARQPFTNIQLHRWNGSKWQRVA